MVLCDSVIKLFTAVQNEGLDMIRLELIRGTSSIFSVPHLSSSTSTIWNDLWLVSYLTTLPLSSFITFWLVVWTPLNNISQLGWLFPIYGKIENVPNHQPEFYHHKPCITIHSISWHRNLPHQVTDLGGSRLQGSVAQRQAQVAHGAAQEADDLHLPRGDLRQQPGRHDQWGNHQHPSAWEQSDWGSFEQLGWEKQKPQKSPLNNADLGERTNHRVVLKRSGKNSWNSKMPTHSFFARIHHWCPFGWVMLWKLNNQSPFHEQKRC